MLKKLKSKFDEGNEKIIGTTYFNLIIVLLIIFGILFFIFLLLQIIDIFVEIFTYKEEAFMFYYLRYLFFGIDLILLIACVVNNMLYFVSISDETKEKDKESFFSFIKLNVTFFIIWTTALFGTFIPRLIILIIKREVIGTFSKVMIYLKMPIVVLLYLLALVICILYKDIKVDELGKEIGIY